MRRINVLQLLSFLVGMLIVSASVSSMLVYLTELPNTSTSPSSLVPHGPISISGNAAFAAQGWPGDGTQQSPYIIEGLEIVTAGTCIYIFNTNVHFVIRNCVLSQTGEVKTNSIRLSHVSNGAIENCSISNGYIGIALIGTIDCTIVNNTLSDCGYYGIAQAASSYNCTLSENRVINCEGYGFHLAYLKYSIVENNYIRNCGEMGIRFQDSENITVADNEIIDSGFFGLYIRSTGNCTFVNNILQNGGFGIVGSKEYWMHNFSENMVNGKPLGYFLGTNNTEIDGNQFGQLFLIDCFNVSLDSGVFFNVSVGPSLLSCSNCTISDMEISENLYGISLFESENTTLRNNTLIECGIIFNGAATEYWTISETGNTVNGKPFGYYLNQGDLTINGNEYGQLVLVGSNHLSIVNGTFASATVGMAIHSCFNCSIRDVLLVDNYDLGIEVSHSLNCTLTNVTIKDSSVGGLQIDTSDYTTVTESEILRNGLGIWVFSSDNYIFDFNQIHENLGYPINIVNTSYGVVRNNMIYDNTDPLELYVVNYLEIVNNTILGSSSDGLHLDFTSGVRILDNRIYGNADYGMNLGSYTLFSEIYNNMIGFNEAGNAVDSGIWNEWDDGVDTGNIWSDYSGEGVYSVGGMGVDNYPLGFLTWQDDVQYVVGSIVPTISWDVRLPNPESYMLLWEGAIIVQNSLNSSLDHISKSINGLSVGSYNLTLVVNDASGYNLVDTVIITVVEETVTTTTTTTTTTFPTTITDTTSTASDTTTGPPPLDTLIVIIIFTIGVVGGIAIVLFVVIRKK